MRNQRGLCARAGAFALVCAAAAPFVAGEQRPNPQLVTEPFTVSGEFEATHREDREHVTVIELVGNYDRRKEGATNVEPRSVVALGPRTSSRSSTFRVW